MGYYLNENGYVCYIRSGLSLSDTHGGRSETHLREIEDIVNSITDKKLEYMMQSIKDIIAETISKYSAEVWQNLISSLKGALNTDVISEVTIAFDNANDIFHSKKAQEYIAKNIYGALEKELNKIKGMKISL